MIIKSDFKDYYDTTLSLGYDDYLVYNRYRKEIEVGDKFFFHDGGRYSEQIKYHSVLIGFCGKVYPVYRVAKVGSDDYKICYTINDFDSFVKANFKEKEYEGYFAKEWNRKHKWQYCQNRKIISKELTAFGEHYDNFEKKYSRIFDDYRCPVYSILTKINVDHSREQRIIVNTCLKEYEFYRIFDSYVVFQEISMFLGNMAEPRKDIPEISDDVMRDIKGFDKFSFRKPKQNK